MTAVCTCSGMYVDLALHALGRPIQQPRLTQHFLPPAIEFVMSALFVGGCHKLRTHSSATWGLKDNRGVAPTGVSLWRLWIEHLP